MVNDYDLIVIGGGSAGLTAAEFGSKIGAKTLLVEASRIGGDCTWTGCVPSKSMVHYSSKVESLKILKEMNLIKDSEELDYNSVYEYIQDRIKTIYNEESPKALLEKGIEVLIGEAKFISNRKIEVNDKEISAKRFIITTGSSPKIPIDEIEGLDKITFYTSDTIFDLKELPEHLVIIGGGPVSCELGQSFHRLGSKVTIISTNKRLLTNDDPDASELILQIFNQQGIETVFCDKIVKTEQKADQVEVITKEGKKISGSHLLVAIGRKPSLSRLNLEEANVTINEGFIEVNKYLRTKNKRIYAAGECIDSYQFTHVAGFLGYVAVRNALLPLSSSAKLPLIAWTTFTSPEIAFAGVEDLFEGLYAKKYSEVNFNLEKVDRAITDSDTTGFVKIYLNKRQRIVGSLVVSPRAGEIIHELILAIKNKENISKIANLMHIYPTYSMLVQQAAIKKTEESLLEGFVGKIIRVVAKLNLFF
ncbi:MAG: dihydrolipoyl dehydrogenase family protein [Candidatus Heimdallarchaeaceae archaeon]